jgi:hypothetical protein
LAALAEMTKKFPGMNPPPGKKKGKRFGKILAKKHHPHSDHSHIDGEVPSKLQRSYSEGSAEYGDSLVDVIEPEDDSSDEMLAEENKEASEEWSDDDLAV